MSLAAACGGSSGQSVTLTATSSQGDPVEITYELDGALVTETVDTPWSQVVEISGDFDLSFAVTNPQEAGQVGCSVNGLGVGPPVAATGEAAASCDASGSITDSSSNVVSSAGGTPRPESDSGVANDAEAGDVATDAATGISAELVIVDDSGVPGELTQFELFDAFVRVTGLDISGDESAIVDGELTYRSPTVTSDVSASELYGPDDVVDGTIGHRLTSGGIVVTDTGQHTITATGTVSVPDQDIEVPFDVAVDFDVEAVEVEAVTTEFLDGALTLDVPSSSRVNESSGWSSFSDEGLGIERPLEADGLDFLVEIFTPDDAVAVAVARSPQPLSQPDLDLAVQQLNESLPTPGTITSATIGGFESQRIQVDDIEGPARLDVFRVADEILVVLAGGPLGDPATFGDAVAIADSIAFDLDAIPRLTHTTVVTSTSNAGVVLSTYEIPANWIEGNPTFTSPDALVGARMGFVAGDESVDSVVAQVVEEAGYLKPATATQIDGVDFAELGADDDVGIRRDFIGAVPGGVLVFTVFDERPEVDRILIDAIIASIKILNR